MKIGELSLANKVLMAPMAGVTDWAFRHLAREQGCALVYTEMISAKGLLYNNENPRNLLPHPDEKGPLGVQLFGGEPDIMAEAARIVSGWPIDIIDVNMGCPVTKVVKCGEGAALMKSPRLAAQIIDAVVKAVNLPVTVKIRKGWDDDNCNAVSFAQRMEDAGAQAVTVHGRTRSQMYGGKADWDIIRQVKEAVLLPVIGNGDIWQPEDGGRMIEETGCDGIMLARGTLGNPWLISRTVQYLTTGKVSSPPAIEERFNMILRHLDLLVADKGEGRGVREMRKFAAWYLKGLPQSAAVRNQVTRAATKEEMGRYLLKFKARLADL